jgi:hypothetical protein
MQSVCTVCGKEFPYYKGKLYCSNSCKTKGHKLKKEGVELQQPISGFNQERTTFYLSDYEDLNLNEVCSFVQYCFFIKNFSEDEEVSFVNDYVRTMVQGYFEESNFEKDLKNNKSPMKKRLIEFEEIYYSGRYKILKERAA